MSGSRYERRADAIFRILILLAVAFWIASPPNRAAHPTHAAETMTVIR